MSNRSFTDLRFLLPADLPSFAHEWLALAAVEPSQIILYDQDYELCECEHALMPTNLRAGGRALPSMAGAAAWMKTIACTQDISPTRLLYVSRENWGNITRKLENYIAIEGVMAEYGFEIVFPESYLYRLRPNSSRRLTLWRVTMDQACIILFSAVPKRLS